MRTHPELWLKNRNFDLFRDFFAIFDKNDQNYRVSRPISVFYASKQSPVTCRHFASMGTTLGQPQRELCMLAQMLSITQGINFRRP